MVTRTKKGMLWMLVNVCRLLVAVTFIFSAIVKIIDPRGTEYKLQDYGEAFGASALLPSYVPLVLAVILALIEFRIGINTLFGIRRKSTSKITLAFMAVMTPLTLYIALYEPVSDCGCFGDAWVLTGWQTFFKNVVLLAATLVLVFFPRYQTRLISQKHQWLVSLYSLLYGIVLASYCIYFLPVIDFRPYHVGADVVKAMTPEGDVEFETQFLMEKDGEQKLFTMDDYPDSTWTFVDTKTIQHGEQSVPEIDNLQIVTCLDGEDITEDILSADGYKFFLVAPYLEWADDGYMDAYERIYDYAEKQDYPFYCLTASGEEGIRRWTDLTGAAYPFAHTDAVTLKTMVRSNPGLILMKGPIVVAKWPCTDQPDLHVGSAPLDQTPMGTPQLQSHVQRTIQLISWFVIPLGLITLVDRLWFGQRMFRAHRIRKKRKKNIVKPIKTNNNEKENRSR